MKYWKIILSLIGCITFVFLSFSTGIAAVGMTVTSFLLPEYNRFLVADLGLTGTGTTKDLFTVQFDQDSSNLDHHLHISVTRVSDNTILLEGNTNSYPYSDTTKFSGKTYDNKNLTDAGSLGGSFNINEQAEQLTDQVLATGSLPEGGFTILLELIRDQDSTVVDSETVSISIKPTFLQPIYPVDLSVSKAALDFRFRSNLERLEFHLYTDPRGNSEIISGGRLPQVVSQGQGSVSGSGIASLLTSNSIYYWQIHGFMKTSHGDELVKGPLSQFLYIEDATTVTEIGPTEVEKSTIHEELLKLLREIVNRRAARSIEGYDIDKIFLDNSIVSQDEIMSILNAIKNKQLKVNTIFFR